MAVTLSAAGIFLAADTDRMREVIALLVVAVLIAAAGLQTAWRLHGYIAVTGCQVTILRAAAWHICLLRMNF